MDLGSLRTLVREVNVLAHGVAATVTRPAPDNTPVSTTGIWLVTPLTEDQPFGIDVRRVDARRVLAITKTTALGTMPRGTVIAAAEEPGGTVKTWRVDGIERADVNYWRVIVALANA
jgi:hypothetical protein